MSRKRRCLVIVIAFACVGIWCYFHWRLSPLERSVVGAWYYAGDVPSTGKLGIVVMELDADRTCRVRVSDRKSGAEIRTIEGRWRIEDTTLTCDWRGRWSSLLPAVKISMTDWPRWTRMDESRVLSVSDSELVVKVKGDLPFTWKRYSENVAS
jgi:hypothetical protein